MSMESEKKTLEVNRGITLVDQNNLEYEYMILDELRYRERDYLALVPCDEKTDMGTSTDPGESNDIIVVRVEGGEEDRTIAAVTDPEELYEIAKIINQKYGHLCEE